MAKATRTVTPAVVAPVAPVALENVGRWAREAAKAASDQPGRAGNRFYGMAIALMSAAPAKGQTGRISFADINAATNLKRGNNSANPRQTWRRAMSAIGELHGISFGKADTVLNLPLHTGATLQVRINEAVTAFDLRTA